MNLRRLKIEHKLGAKLVKTYLFAVLHLTDHAFFDDGCCYRRRCGEKEVFIVPFLGSGSCFGMLSD